MNNVTLTQCNTPTHTQPQNCHHRRKLQLCQKDSQNKQAMLTQASNTKQKGECELRSKLDNMEESNPQEFLELLKDFAKEFLVSEC